jgi:hypothetical protein
MADYKIGHSHTGAAYDSDNPLRLAKEIDATLDKYGLGNKHHLFTSIKFFEDELRPIADCLRCAGPQKIAKQSRVPRAPVCSGRYAFAQRLAEQHERNFCRRSKKDQYGTKDGAKRLSSRG